MGWNRSEDSGRDGRPSSAAKPPRSANRGVLHGLLAGIVVVVIGGGAVWWLIGTREDAAEVTRVGKGAIAEVESAKSVPVAETQSVTTVVAPAPTKPVESVRQTVQMRTLPDGTKEPVSKPYFSNHVERAISTLCNPGGMAISFSVAMRHVSDEEIMRILKAPMEYDKNDSDFIMVRKMEMQRIKKELLDYIAEGHTVREALIEADKTIRRDSSYLMMTRRSMQQALVTKDAEVIRKYTEKLNEDLEARGMKPFEVPEQFRKTEDSEEVIEDEANE